MKPSCAALPLRILRIGSCSLGLLWLAPSTFRLHDPAHAGPEPVIPSVCQPLIRSDPTCRGRGEKRARHPPLRAGHRLASVVLASALSDC